MKKTRTRAGEVSRSWLIAGAAIIAVLLACEIFSEVSSEMAARELAGGPSAIAEVEVHDLVLRAWVERKTLAPGERTRLYLVALNGSSTTLEALQVRASSSQGDLEPVPPCWQGDLPTCTDSAGRPKGVAGGRSLPPGSSALYWGELKALRPSADGSRITATFFWKVQGNPESLAALTVGPLSLREQEGWWLLVARAVLAFFKDMGLPILLGVLGYLFQRLQQGKARRQETFTVLLPRAHENIVKHLLGVLGAFGRFKRMLAEAKTSARNKSDPLAYPSVSFRQAYFYLLSMVKRIRDMAEQGGGIFFADLQGEVVVNRCWSEILRSIELGIGAEQLSLIMDRWGKAGTFTSLEGRLKPPPAPAPAPAPAGAGAPPAGAAAPPSPAAPPAVDLLTPSRDAFADWLVSGRADFNEALLDAFAAVMEYEVNRLYSLWYHAPGEPPTEKIVALQAFLTDARLGAVPAADEKARLKNLRKNLELYRPAE